MLAGFPDGRANDGVAAGPASLVGLELATSAATRHPQCPRTPTDGEATR